MSGVKPDTTGLEAIHNQPEFTVQLWQYLNRATSDWKIAAGREKAQQYAPLLARIESDYGVEPSFMLGVWGIESAFGDPVVEKNHMRPVIPSLATLAWAEPRRRSYWESELINALTIVQRGWSTPADMVGSWAGAMGHTQWMPEVWLHVGIDYDGDGKISPYGPPDDALASTARYFVERGNYQRGEHWGYEVRLPGHAARGHSRSYAEWQKLGVVRADGEPFPRPNGESEALGAGAWRSRVSDWSELLRGEELQSIHDLRARACASRRPLRRRRAFRAGVSRQRALPDARRIAGNSAPAHRARLRYRRRRRPYRERHHARRARTISASSAWSRPTAMRESHCLPACVKARDPVRSHLKKTPTRGTPR